MQGPARVTVSEVKRRARFCRIDSAASVCSSGPETTTPLGMPKRSPSSSAVPPIITFLSLSVSSVAPSPRSTSTRTLSESMRCEY
jgi:hypothetical protein